MKLARPHVVLEKERELEMSCAHACHLWESGQRLAVAEKVCQHRGICATPDHELTCRLGQKCHRADDAPVHPVVACLREWRKPTRYVNNRFGTYTRGMTREDMETYEDRLFDASAKMECLVRSNVTFLVGRPSMGSEVLAAWYVQQERPLPASVVRSLASNAGVTTRDEGSAARYARAYADSLLASDLVVRWDHSRFPAFHSRPGTHDKIDALLDAVNARSVVITHEALEPVLLATYTGRSWMPSLVGKRVLVVCGNANEMRRQVLRFQNPGRSLFGGMGTQVLPSGIDFVFAKPPINIAVHNKDTDWTASLASLEAKVASLQFDVALVACGGIGMLFCAGLKRRGRSCIYSGGSLQLQFGVRGKRWNSMTEYRILMRSENWTHARQPPLAHTIEGGAYW